MARDGSPIVEILAIFAIVFVLQYLAALFNLAVLAGLFVLQPPIESSPWTAVTSVYAHANLSHLVSNSVAFVLFGWPVARATSRAKFHAFFLATGAVAGVSQIVVTGALASAPLVPATPTAGVLGASGAVFALLGYLLAANRLSTSLGGVVSVPRWVTAIVFVIVAGFVTVATGAPGVALVAHFTGLLFGLVAGWFRVLRV
ncbi:rhomboid family intramembrane serine protease [Halovivax gelatinilyticus]|uniref:rhomboid family intramembrane serine protease n=1 Tax=Halovivax gelatinilyticus TaxID=2961597 RepID=UPI0020CA8F52|nr:rhomboid family intramembrane serine protease [Halovivax gelatinilyticus]